MSYRLRRAIGGFHRGDVIAYVQKLVQQHKTECLRLQTELECAQRELEALRAACAQPGETASEDADPEKSAAAPDEDAAPRYF